MRLHVLALVVAASPMAARAAPEGPEFGLRFGYAVPFGDVLGGGNTAPDVGLRDVVSAGIPLTLELGYRFAPDFYGGVSVGYGYLFTTGCDPSANCTGHDVRLGLDLRFHLAPTRTLDPWIGVGVGYEWLTLSASSGGQDQDLTVRGFEFLNLQLGADLFVSPVFRIGPFALFSFGRYTDATASSALLTTAGELADKRVHEWLVLGLRAAFSP
jgi:hypothetical protein